MSAQAACKTPAETHAEPMPLPVLTRAPHLRLHKRCACGGDAHLTGECEGCAQRRFTLQRRHDGAAVHDGGIPASVDHALAQPGRSLDSASRQLMEARFGQDFSAVRIHDDGLAAQSARDVRALAYTVGQDIVFAPGHYQPHSESGRHLLAHELAHTVQQRGLQRRGSAGLADQGPEYRRLEFEADRAADIAVRGAAPRTVGELRPASRPMLSRQASGTPTPASAPPATDITVVAAELGSLTFQVTPDGAASAGGAGPSQRRFRCTPFYLPGQKGALAQGIYERFAQAGQLQAVLQIVGTSAQRTAQWQQRDYTEVLGDSWVRSVRWTAADRDASWSGLAAGNAFPRTAAGACNIDHIVELQVSGGNDPQNMQALDATPNQSSGRAIWNEVRSLGTAIARTFAVPDGSQVQIIFGSVQVSGALEPHVTVAGSPRSCLMIDAAARAAGGTPAAAGAPQGRNVRLETAATGNDFVVPANWGAANRDAPLAGNSENAAAAQMLSGFVLQNLHHQSANAATVRAQFDPRSRTRLPITVEGERGNTIDLAGTKQPAGPAGGETYRLTLTDRTTNIAFNYTYLSPGRITRLGFAPDGALHFRGEITPNVPFLPRPLLIIYENETLRLAVELDRNRLRSPIPAFRLTEAHLELGLAPTLSANGHLAFALGTGARPIATGTADVTADSSGLSATGRLLVHIPGVDEASGTINYRDGAWSGQIVIETTQIRLPNVQRGRLQLDIDATGLRPSGELELLLPRNLGNATLGFHREGTRFVYTGNGTLRVPGLREVPIEARYDGVNLHAAARNVGFTWHGLDGSIDVAYDARGDSPGRITGTGRLTIARGDVTGSIAVTLHNSGRFSGQGRLTYPFTVQGQRIEASAGVIVTEDQNVRVEGAVRFPQPIQLFRRFGDNKQLFHFQRSIPIPGLSIGPVGVVAVIEGGVSARYGFGPGQLRNVALEAAFNPLAQHIDPNVSFHCDLHVPAEAGITGTIGGGLGVEAGIGRVNGTLTVSADLGLNAVLGGPLDLRYQDRRFAVTARPGIDASLALGLSLDAHARAEAGIGMFSVGIEKSWNLGRRSVVLGRFSMHAPIAWSNDAGFTAPSIDEIEWGPMPEIDPGDLLSQLFRSSSAEERTP